jgi:hypothetical protein
MERSMIDKLMEMSVRHAADMAELWYKSLSTNPRTVSTLTLPKQFCIFQATTIYSSLSTMYQADDCYSAVERLMEKLDTAAELFKRGVPIEDALYALILLRRRIWLYADSQAVFNTSPNDMYNCVDSINRVLLIFDYITYIFSRKYHQLTVEAFKAAAFSKTDIKK